jgi:hypothetical protein
LATSTVLVAPPTDPSRHPATRAVASAASASAEALLLLLLLPPELLMTLARVTWSEMLTTTSCFRSWCFFFRG